MLTTSQQPDTRALLATAERAEAKAKAAATARTKALAERMNSVAGRAIVYDELAPLRTQWLRADEANRIDETATLLAIARHDLAVLLSHELEAACPDSVVAMVREAMDRRKDQ